jgi:GH24 family phage-related lysozyme (muramidase)
MRTVTKFGVVLTLAGAGLLGFLDRWETDHKAPGRVYPDKLARGLPTVCKGITKHVSPYPVVIGDWWSPAKCAEVEQMVTEKGQIRLLSCFKVRVGQSQLDSFYSHSHNFGEGATCASRAMGLTNAGRAVEGCKALSHAQDGRTPVWSYITDAQGNKVFVPGLYARRKAETAMCLKGLS